MGRVLFTGGKELQKALLQLSQKEAKRVGRAALRKAAKPILEAARARVPVHEGRLKRALRLRVDTLRNNRSVMSAMVDVKNTDYRARKTDRQSTVKGVLGPAKYDYQIGSMPKVYGRFVEYGVHGPPQPFMRPAWDSLGGSVALARIGKELGEGLEQAASGMKRGR